MRDARSARLLATWMDSRSCIQEQRILMSRKFYKTTYVVEILSEEPIPEDVDLRGALEEAEVGSYSGDVKSQETVEVDGATMARLLLEQRSDPAFFRLADDGEDEDGDT